MTCWRGSDQRADPCCPASHPSFGAGDSGTDAHDRILQRLQVLLASFPEDGWIGIVVIVPQNVTDTGDCAPRDLRFSILVLIGKAPASFRQDLKISLYKLPGPPIPAKPLEVTPRNIRLDIAYRLENVTDVDRRVFVHQNTASVSRRTRLRMAGSSPPLVTTSTLRPSLSSRKSFTATKSIKLNWASGAISTSTSMSLSG